MAEEKLPPVPRFQWDTFAAILRETRAVLRSCVDKPLAGEALQKLQLDLYKVLPDRVSAGVVQLSLNHLVGATLSARELNQLAYRFVAQREQLSNGTPLRIVATELEKFWVAAYVVDAYRSRRNGKFGVSLRFRVVSSPVSPVDITQWWSNRRANYMAYYRDPKRIGFGFSPLRLNKTGTTQRGLHYVHAAQFFGLRCFLYLSDFRNEKWNVSTIGHSSSTMKYNAALLRGRERSISACVKDAEESKDCWYCPVGLDGCAFATHSISYAVGTCSRCGNADSTLSPEKVTCDACTEGG